MSDELYNKYYNQLLKWCCKKTSNYSDAEELVQEIFYQIVLAYSKDIIIIDEERFLWKVAYYTWCNRAKKYEKEKKTVSLNDNYENFIRDESVDILRKIEADEIKDILLDNISKLNDITKKCVILYYYENISVKKIADILKIKESLVKYYLYQARIKLRSELKNENI